MRTLRTTLLAIAAVLILIFVVGLFLPSEAHVERSTTIDAPPDVVYSQISDFTTWPAWSAWFDNDPTMEATFSEKSSGIGASYSWSSENSGAGEMTIMEADPPNSMKTLIDFGEMGISNGSWKLVPAGENSTKVTWGFDSELSGILDRYMGLAMDSFLGPDFEQGLAKLKTLAEEVYAEKIKEEQAAQEAAAAAADSTQTMIE